jgi:hypothetical protein
MHLSIGCLTWAGAEASCAKTATSANHAVQVELWLVAGASDSCFSLSANRQNRRVVQFGVV